MEVKSKHPHVEAVEELVRACYNYAGLNSKRVGMFSDSRREYFSALKEHTNTSVAEALDRVAALQGNYLSGEIAVNRFDTLLTWEVLRAMTNSIAQQIAQGLEYLIEQLGQHRNRCYVVFRKKTQLRVLTVKRFELIQPLINVDTRWNYHLVSAEQSERIAQTAQAAYARLGHRQRMMIGLSDFHPKPAQQWAAVKNR